MPIDFATPTEFYSNQLERLHDKFPNSRNSINKKIDSLKETPRSSPRLPGFGDREVRKLKIPLKEYNISAQQGLRLIAFIADQKIYCITIFHKGEFNKKNQIKRLILDGLSAIKKKYFS